MSAAPKPAKQLADNMAAYLATYMSDIGGISAAVIYDYGWAPSRERIAELRADHLAKVAAERTKIDRAYDAMVNNAARFDRLRQNKKRAA